MLILRPSWEGQAWKRIGWGTERDRLELELELGDDVVATCLYRIMVHSYFLARVWQAAYDRSGIRIPA